MRIRLDIHGWPTIAAISIVVVIGVVAMALLAALALDGLVSRAVAVIVICAGSLLLGFSLDVELSASRDGGRP